MLGRMPRHEWSIRLSIEVNGSCFAFPLPSPDTKSTPTRYPSRLFSPGTLRGHDDCEAIDTCSHAGKIGCCCGTRANPWPNVESQTGRRSAHDLTRPDHKAEGIDAMNIDRPQEMSATKASGGVKLHAMRYVLGISISLAAMAGVILWNIYATH
jgi:hypothetical protein